MFNQTPEKYLFKNYFDFIIELEYLPKNKILEIFSINVKLKICIY